MIDISKCNSISDVARLLYNGNSNYYNRKRAKKYLEENNIDVEEFLLSKKKKPTYCINCGKELKSGQKKFCCHSCSATYNNKQRGEYCSELKSKISKGVQKYYHSDYIYEYDFSDKYYCLNCGKEMVFSPRSLNKFCSRHWKNEYEYNEYIKRWRNGEENGLSGNYNISKYIRKYIFEKNENKCEICGWDKINPYTNKIPLQIHHKDGNCLNNKEENLELLCPSCHSLTENYGSRNKNCTRIDLRKR